MEVSSQNFEAKIIQQSYKTPIVIQFHAPWCGPCKQLKPVLQQVHETSELKWDLAFANVKDYPILANKFKIFTIPDVRLIENGKITASFSGFKPAYVIQNWLDSNLEVKKSDADNPIISQLKTNDIEKVKESLLELAVEENPQSDYLKLLMAVQHLETNNANAMQWIQKIERGGPLDPLVKGIRNLIDSDKEDKNPTTPTSSPYTIEPEKAIAKINIATFDFALLSNLVYAGVNEIRKNKGVAPLTTHPILNQAALDQNNYQIRTNNLTHYQDNPIKKTVRERVDSFGGGQFNLVGENVQFQGFPVRSWSNTTQTEVITPTYLEAAENLIKNWVNSPGHYKNMIKAEYRFVGTAVGWNAENSAVYSTQVFGA